MDFYIRSLAYHLPPGRLSNDDVLHRVKLANEKTLSGDELDLLLYSCSRKFDFLGIRTRSVPLHLSDDNFTSMSVKAARKALSAMKGSLDRIDCVIAGGISNPYREPSAACIIARMLSLPDADHFDLNDTCNSFMKAMEIAYCYMKAKNYLNVLVVACENPTELEVGLGMNITVQSVDEIDNRLSGLIIGSAAAAAVVSVQPSGRRILHYVNKKENSHWDSSCIRIPHTMMPQTKYSREVDGFFADARGMSAELIQKTPEFASECLSQWGISLSDIQHLVLHQLGNNITYAMIDKMGFPHERAPVNTFAECGNCGSVNIPLNLALAEEKGFLSKGDLILLVNSSCGFTYSAALIQW